MNKEDKTKEDTRVHYSEEEKKDPIAGLEKEIKRLGKKIKKLKRSVIGSKK
jgi:hypothetical protein